MTAAARAGPGGRPAAAKWYNPGVGDRSGSVDAGSLSASQRVHVTLRSEILEGRLEPGGAIPSERILAERFGVNRHAVREALKRLEQAGLIRITHGGSTRVLDWREAGGLGLLLDLAGGTADPPPEIVRSVIEMRASIGIDAARLCARRADPETRRTVADRAAEAADLIESGEDDERLDLVYAAFWRAIVFGAGNIAYRLALNSLLQAMLAFEGVFEALRPTEADPVRRLGEAIAAEDQEATAEAARAILDADAVRLA